MIVQFRILIFPKESSVNDGVLKDSYLGTRLQIYYFSVGSIMWNLTALGPTAKIFKVNISQTLRHIQIYLGDIGLLDLQYQNKLFLTYLCHSDVV